MYWTIGNLEISFDSLHPIWGYHKNSTYWDNGDCDLGDYKYCFGIGSLVILWSPIPE